MIDRNPSLESYRARVHVDVRMLNFPFSRAEARRHVVLPASRYLRSRVRSSARLCEEVFSASSTTSATRRRGRRIKTSRSTGRRRLDGRTMLVLRLTKKIHSTILDHTLALRRSAELRAACRWNGTTPAAARSRCRSNTARQGSYSVLSSAARDHQHPARPRGRRCIVRRPIKPTSRTFRPRRRSHDRNATPPRNGSPEETRERILAAAREVIATKGKRGATTREIADVAGVNEATFFRHFGTKEALIIAVAQHFCGFVALRETSRAAPRTDRRRSASLGRKYARTHGSNRRWT